MVILLSFLHSLSLPSLSLFPFKILFWFLQDTQQEQGPSLEDCLKLLKGVRDEQRLAGLLLVTKFCKGDDHSSLHRVYDAVGPFFLDRLLKTGILFLSLTPIAT